MTIQDHGEDKQTGSSFCLPVRLERLLFVQSNTCVPITAGHWRLLATRTPMAAPTLLERADQAVGTIPDKV